MVILARRIETVNAAVFDAVIPIPIVHCKDESEYQMLASNAVAPTRPDKDTPPNPKFSPLTALSKDPVRGWFGTSRKSPRTTSTLKAFVALPCRSPADKETLFEVDSAWPILHRIDVSDSHSLASHTLPPTLPIDDHPATPRPAPTTVRLADPVAAPFIPRSELDRPLSVDMASVALPCRSPAVIRTALVPPSPAPILQRTDVSDSHSLASHPLPPVRPETDAPATPIPDPTTVTLDDPVAARFAMASPLACVRSADIVSVTLPSRSPTVSAASFVPFSPYPTAHRTDVSDSHPLLSHALLPVRPDADDPASPMLDPATVTLVDPVAATFDMPSKLAIPGSADSAEVVLPCRRPAVRLAIRVPASLCPTWHTTDVSDAHVLASQELPDTRDDPEADHSPKLDPTTVTLDDPVAA